MDITIHHWLSRFALDAFLHDHVAGVMSSLPMHVQSDLVDDPAFSLCDYEPSHTGGFVVPVASPGRITVGRAVVLKRTLRRRPVEFVRYVIAHELAHAHLRNGGRFPGEDPERAADALAEEWGYPRPARWPW